MVVAGAGSAWWQYLLLFLAVTASWAGVPFIGTAAAGAAAVAASQGRLNLAAVICLEKATHEANPTPVRSSSKRRSHGSLRKCLSFGHICASFSDPV